MKYVIAKKVDLALQRIGLVTYVVRRDSYSLNIADFTPDPNKPSYYFPGPSGRSIGPGSERS